MTRIGPPGDAGIGLGGGVSGRSATVVLIALLAVGMIAVALGRLEAATRELSISRINLDGIPVTVFRPADRAGRAGEAPVAVIAHGFAGSQQLMLPFATTLARSGFIAVTFDFPGHGRNSAPMRGGLADLDESQRTLLRTLERMGLYARSLAGADGRYALIGHSMASDLVVRHAQRDPAVQATVGVSLFAPSIVETTPPDSPRNLLVVDGSLEPAMLRDEALRVIGRVAGPQPQRQTTYGRFEDGTARRATLSPGVEHIGVLYSRSTQAETLAWLNDAFGRAEVADPFIDARGPSLGLLMAGIQLLAWPLSRWLPRLRASKAAAPRRAQGGDPDSGRRRWWGRRGDAAIVLLPALLTPLLLWRLPSQFLPLLLGDYLVLHFGVYGLLTITGLVLSRRPMPRIDRGRAGWFIVGLLLASAYGLLAVGIPIDRYVFNVQPIAARLPLVAAMCAGTLLWFVADEWLTRDAAAPRGAYLATKVAFLLSLVLAIVLNPPRLFFLALIVPAILLLFVVYGLFSRWAMRRTGHPMVGAVANGLAFGCFIAVTFPLVA